MRTTTVYLTFALVLLFGSTVFAVDPDATPQETTPQTEIELDADEGAPLPFPEQMIVGKVTGSDDNPVAGVTMKLFADGEITEIAHTTSSGDFEMPLPLMIDRDETVVLWFIDSSGNYPPQSILIKKSSKAESASLFSKCTREVRMRPQMRVDFKLMTDTEMAASYKARGCL